MNKAISAVNFSDVSVTGGMWKKIMDTNRSATLPIEYKQCKDTGRIDAFRLSWKEGQPNQPHIFWDSDVAKWIEAAAYSLSSHPDKVLEKKVDGVIKLIASAQGKDGYVNSTFQTIKPKERWKNLNSNHELYCAGHLIEAAVAYNDATGKGVLLDVMCRYADYIDKVFGPGKGQKKGYPGHEEIELALVKLYLATGEARYLKLSEFFVNQRGATPHYFDQEAKLRDPHPWDRLTKTGTKRYEYSQAHVPVRQQKEVVGHAVRAVYLYSAMADVAAHTRDKDLLSACKALWQNLTKQRMHITGGIGPRHSNEGMSSDYDLPAEGAYLETCAAVGLVFWAHRMFLAEGDSTYADVMERCLYNGTISGVSQDGKSFFYGNPLAVQPGFNGNGQYAGSGYHYKRSEWFGCACCPPNIARMIAQFPGYIYAVKNTTLYANLYCSSRATAQVNGESVAIEQETHYPWDEKIALTVNPASRMRMTLALRIPDWCKKTTLKVNGKSIAPKTVMRRGYALIKREWEQGDVVELTLAMPVERIYTHPSARQMAGKVALQRGPVVYCLEGVDNGSDLSDIVLPARARFTVESGSGRLAGVSILSTEARAHKASEWKGKLYQNKPTKLYPRTITAVPYYLWNNRAAGEMTVFLNQG